MLRHNLKEALAGIREYATAYRVIMKYRLWPYMIVPGGLSMLYLLLFVLLGMKWFPPVSDYLYQNWIPAFLQWQITHILTTVLLWLLMLFTVFITYQPVILILLSPIFGYISEITERKLRQSPSPPFSWAQIFRDLYRSLLFNLRNFLRMFGIMLLAWGLILIPVLGTMASTAIIFFVQAAYGGIALVDYTLERKQFTVPQRIAFSKTHRGRITGLGIGFVLVLLIPVVGWFAAPSIGTVAATLSTLDLLDELEKKVR